jgi:hypothetical protein
MSRHGRAPIKGIPFIAVDSTVDLANGQAVVATCGDDGTVRLWNPLTGAMFAAPDAKDPHSGYTDRMSAVAFGTLADGQAVLATGTFNGVLAHWHWRFGPA